MYLDYGMLGEEFLGEYFGGVMMDLFAQNVMVSFIWFFTWFAIACLSYFIPRHILSCIGKKAGLGNEWMPYIPIARAIYLCDIAGVTPFFSIFLSDAIKLIFTAIFFYIFAIALDASTFFFILIFLYYVACYVFTVYTYSKLFERFGFHRFTSLLVATPVFSMVGTAMLAVLGYSPYITLQEAVPQGVDERAVKRIVRDELNRGASRPNDGSTVAGGGYGMPARSQGAGSITGIKGKYLGAKFILNDGEQLVLGRNAERANIVFETTNLDVSREHCIVKFVGGQYLVTDLSTNGTYLSNGEQIGKGNSRTVNAGDMISLGKNKKDAFRLG